MKKIISITLILLFLLSSTLFAFDAEKFKRSLKETQPWDSWVQQKTKDLEFIKDEINKKREMQAISEMTAALVDLELKWKEIGPCKEIKPFVYKAKMKVFSVLTFRPSEKYDDLLGSLQDLYKLLDELYPSEYTGR